MPHDVADPGVLRRSTILTLDAATDVSACGNKAATLAELRAQGFDVPDGFVIPAGAEPTHDDIVAALARLGDGPVAVRSSGLAEDLPDASFAGQYDTWLNVRGADAVLAAVAACVAAARSARVEAYRHSFQPMAVLVQRMIDANVAGVAFSANPLTGNRDEVRVSATRGLGDTLVSGGSDGDEWVVAGDRATAVAQPQGALDPDMARRVASLAREAERARSAPQDIEWAVVGDRLWLLQSRPITALPVRPEFDVPTGTWQKDAGHFAEPLSPFAASTQLRDSGSFFSEAIAKWGLMPDAMNYKVVGHEPYMHVEPDDGGKTPPPWWLLGIVARLVPAMRRKLAASAAAIDAGWLDSMPAEWDATHRPRLRSEIERFAAMDLATLDTPALFRHLDELVSFYTRSLQLHFTLAIPYSVGLYELATACEELLGWNLQRMAGLFQGLSAASTAPTDELVALARRASQRFETRAVLESRSPDVIARLEAIDPRVAQDLRRYLQFWGLRPLGPEAGSPCVSEQPQLVADLLADVISDEAPRDLSAARLACVGAARARLSGANRERFDAALAYAERIYPLREDNVLLTDQLPAGLLRRVGLEAGRRLVDRGLIGRTEDAMMLTADELRHALDTGDDVRRLVSRRRAEHAWVRANPGPATYGPEPGAPPDLRGLPEPARRVNTALLWMIGHEISPPPQADGDGVAGIGVSPGVYRGRVRVITSADHVHSLRVGEVLVCPTTSAAWMMVFQRAGAVVADTGSVLSHTAIVAREFALPAVVAAAGATAKLTTGEEVIVDGTKGTVTRC